MNRVVARDKKRDVFKCVCVYYHVYWYSKVIFSVCALDRIIFALLFRMNYFVRMCVRVCSINKLLKENLEKSFDTYNTIMSNRTRWDLGKYLSRLLILPGDFSSFCFLFSLLFFFFFLFFFLIKPSGNKGSRYSTILWHGRKKNLQIKNAELSNGAMHSSRPVYSYSKASQ